MASVFLLYFFCSKGKICFMMVSVSGCSSPQHPPSESPSSAYSSSLPLATVLDSSMSMPDFSCCSVWLDVRHLAPSSEPPLTGHSSSPPLATVPLTSVPAPASPSCTTVFPSSPQDPILSALADLFTHPLRAISRHPYTIRSALLVCTQNIHVAGDHSCRWWQYSIASWDFLCQRQLHIPLTLVRNVCKPHILHSLECGNK
jgi:hypothetical protein